MKFRVLLKDENGTYIAECLDLPDCISQGNTKEEALNNIRDTIKDYISHKKHDESLPIEDNVELDIIKPDLYRYYMFGKVIPERVNFSLKPPITLRLKTDRFEWDITFSILLSQISIYIESSKEITDYETLRPDYETLRNYVMDYISTWVDAFCYINGYGYDIEITSIYDPIRNYHDVFGVGIKSLEEDKLNRPYKEQLGEIISLFIADPNKPDKPTYSYLRRALQDLRLSIKFFNESPFYCYRAIESLMQHFKDKYNLGDSNKDTSKAWNKLRDHLNVSKDYIVKGIKPLADEIRHGKPKGITADERVKIMKRTWLIVDRFIIYAKNGEKPLDKQQHSELTL